MILTRLPALVLLFALLACAQKIPAPAYYENTSPAIEFTGRIEPDSIDLELLEYAIFCQTNAERQRLGLWPLRFEPRARVAARIHSEEMIQLSYFSHTSPVKKNQTLGHRLRQVGLREGMSAENIAIYPIEKRQEIFVEKRRVDLNLTRDFWRNQGIYFTYDEFAKTLVESWMNSPGHRRNILSRDYKFLGVGCAVGRLNNSDVCYVTQNFSSTNY
jgi:uncharacterized protein YkwD